MTLNKDNVIKDILSDFEEFAHLILHKLDTLEKIANHATNIAEAAIYSQKEKIYAT